MNWYICNKALYLHVFFCVRSVSTFRLEASLLQFCIRERLHLPVLQGIREHLPLPVPTGCFVVVNVSTSLPSRVFVNISPSLSCNLQGDFDTLKLAKLFLSLLPVSHSAWFQTHYGWLSFPPLFQLIIPQIIFCIVSWPAQIRSVILDLGRAVPFCTAQHTQAPSLSTGILASHNPRSLQYT